MYLFRHAIERKKGNKEIIGEGEWMQNKKIEDEILLVFFFDKHFVFCVSFGSMINVRETWRSSLCENILYVSIKVNRCVALSTCPFRSVSLQFWFGSSLYHLPSFRVSNG